MEERPDFLDLLKFEYVILGRRHPGVSTILHTVAQCEKWGHDDKCVNVYERRPRLSPIDTEIVHNCGDIKWWVEDLAIADRVRQRIAEDDGTRYTLDEVVSKLEEKE